MFSKFPGKTTETTEIEQMWGAPLTGQWGLGSLQCLHGTRLPPTSPVSDSGLGTCRKTEETGSLGREGTGDGKIVTWARKKGTQHTT
jgi:hypothetical protein